ncbi:MAG: S1 family peptidase, partial [Lysobacterales bacterium]
ILTLVACLVSSGIQAESSEPDTPDLYSLWHDRVVQVQVIDQKAQSKAGIGSGFFTGEPGWIITNYHVIAELANRPGRYRARYVSASGLEGSLELLAVDAVHDLAVLRAEDFAPEGLLLGERPPPKGSRLYALGYPYDIGLTIVEGTFNGMLEKSLYEKIHFTGSINPGMSGGPALGHAGNVVGINVATAGDQVSFLVPAHYAAKLIAQTRDKPATTDFLGQSVSRQLRQNQESVSSRLLAGEIPRTRLNGYLVPGAMAPYISCWGDSQEDRPDELAQVFYRCQTQDDIFLSESLYTGVIQYQHELLSSDRMHSLRFYKQLENRGYYAALQLEGDEQSVSNYRCQSDFIEQAGLNFKATFCVRRYRLIDGLYDSYLALTSLVDDDEALQSTLVLAGFSWTNITSLSTRFIESISLGEVAQ